MSNVVLALFALKLGNTAEEEYVVEMAILEEIPQEIEKILNNDLQKPDNSSVTHQAQNTASKPRLPEPEPIESLADIMANRVEQTSEEVEDNYLAAANGYGGSLKEFAKKRAQLKTQLENREKQKKVYSESLKANRTTISYSLVDRTAYHIPPPIYTCLEGGKVVINIKVDNNGLVTEVSFNEKSSSTTDYCLMQNAMEYAKKAYFNTSTKTSQIGTITYYFQPK